jgi:hypothetical protein
MGAQAYPVQAAPIGSRPSTRRWRPPAHAWLALAACCIVAGLVTNADAVQAAAIALCTTGAPDDATCGEALWLLGYP